MGEPLSEGNLKKQHNRRAPPSGNLSSQSVRQLEGEGRSFFQVRKSPTNLSFHLPFQPPTALCHAREKESNYIFDKFSFETANRRAKRLVSCHPFVLGASLAQIFHPSWSIQQQCTVHRLAQKLEEYAAPLPSS